MQSQNISVILAHGAWADGSSWNKVIALLKNRGVRAIAAPLPLTSLTDDVTSLHRTLERVEGPVVLAAHAYAGAVIAAARDDKIQALVYIAALAPDEDETVADVFYRAEPHPIAPKLAPDRHGQIWLPDDAFSTAFAQHASPEEQALLAAVQRPISASCITAKVPRPLWKDRPSWFLVAEEDRMITPSTQLFMAGRMRAQVQTHPSDHAPILTAPDTVTGMILDALHNGAGR